GARLGRRALEDFHHVEALRRLDGLGHAADRRLEGLQHRVAGQLLRGLREREARRLAGGRARLLRGRGEVSRLGFGDELLRALAPCSFARTSSAFAFAARSAASALRRSRICAATSLSGVFPPGCTSVTLIAWKPKGVRTGSAEISPGFIANAACSNCGTISPL